MTRYGMTLESFEQPLAALEPAVKELTDLGYQDVWTGENYIVDAFTPLVLASIWAPELRLGVGVAQAFTRGPAILAMQIAGLCQAAPGRVVAGIGPSSKIIVEDWNAVPFERPYSRVRDTIAFLRAALAGEKISRNFDSFRVENFQLRAEVEIPPTLMVGASRPRLLTLGAELADGVILSNVSADDVKQIAPLVKAANPDAEIVGLIHVSPNRPGDEVRRDWRRKINEYINAPAYAAAQAWLGHADSLQQSWDKWKAGDRKGAAAAIPDDFMDSMVLHGPSEECRAKIQAYVDAGVDTVVIDLDPPDSTRAIEAARALAPA